MHRVAPAYAPAYASLGPAMLLPCALAIACASGTGAVEGKPLGPAPQDSGAAEDGPPAVDLRGLDALLDAAWAEQPFGAPGLGLLVIDAEGQQLYAGLRGALQFTDRMPIASGTKLVSGLVALRLVEQGLLPSDHTTGEALGWAGPEGAVRFDQLHAFNSGLVAGPDCVSDPRTSLQACADAIGAAGLVATPGSFFTYGSGHQAVAGAMMERVTGQTWAALFTHELAAPLGLSDPGLRYVTLPQRGFGETNPLIAGGLLATAEEVAALLQLILAGGEHGGVPLLSAPQLDRLFIDAFPDAAIGSSPLADLGYPYRYGFGSWLLCEPSDAPCPVIASPGSYGFTPWLDRERGYAAILVLDAGETGAWTWAFPQAERMRAEIEAALDRAVP
jgi:D-alanyl-D-alanine-carboxypeptidase/D-alanyl-D-alanine-endopeptidase